MNCTKIINHEDLNHIIVEYLKKSLALEDFKIVFSKLEALDWRVKIVFKEENLSYYIKAWFLIDAGSGEVKSFKKGAPISWSETIRYFILRSSSKKEKI